MRADVRDTGKHLGINAPIPELLYVQGSEKHGTLREVQGAIFELSLVDVLTVLVGWRPEMQPDTS